MKTKYRLVIYLGLLLLLCNLLFACKQSGEQQDKTQAKQEELVIGTDNYPPYTYIADDGKIMGIDIELAQEAARRMHLKPVFKMLEWDEKDKLLAAGEIDCIWSCFSLNNRENIYDWAGPYLASRHVIVVPKRSTVHKISDLAGRRLVVQAGTQPEKIFLERKRSDVPQLHDLYCTNDIDVLFASLQLGYADATACNEIVARQYAHKFPGDFTILSDVLLETNLGVAFAKGKNQDKVKKLDEVLKGMQSDGTIDKIVAKYALEKGRDLQGGVNTSAVK